MKVKPWHIGCIIVLIAAALYFLVGMREGLDNPACWGNVLDASNGQFVDLFEAATSIRGKYSITLDAAKTECAADTTCNGVVTGPGPGGSTVYSVYRGNPAIVPVDANRLPAPGIRTFYAKKACDSSPPPAPSLPNMGSSDSSSCWEDPVDGGYQAPGTNETRFVSNTSYNSFMTKQMPRIQACFGGSFPAQGTQPTPSQMECVQKLSYPSLDEAKAACAADSSCTAILSQTDPGSGSGRYQKFSEDATIVETAGARYPNMKLYVKKPCASLLPMPPGPTGTAGGASMTSSLPTPSSSSSFNLTCKAAPVSGMVGSVTGSDGVAPWNVSQPSPGWNSKHGYTTTGN